MNLCDQYSTFNTSKRPEHDRKRLIPAMPYGQQTLLGEISIATSITAHTMLEGFSSDEGDGEPHRCPSSFCPATDAFQSLIKLITALYKLTRLCPRENIQDIPGLLTRRPAIIHEVDGGMERRTLEDRRAEGRYPPRFTSQRSLSDSVVLHVTGQDRLHHDLLMETPLHRRVLTAPIKAPLPGHRQRSCGL